MSEEIKNMVTDIQKTWAEMKSKLEEQEKEVKKFGESGGETKSTLEKLHNRLDELEVKTNKTFIETKATKTEDSVEKKGFKEFLTKGIITPEFKSVMINSNDTTGGYFTMPDVISGEILKDIIEFSPIRPMCRQRTTTSNRVEIMTRTASVVGGYWGSETEARANLGVATFGKEEIPVHNLTGYVDVSVQNLEDADFNLEAEINSELAEQFGLTESYAFLLGTGVKQPEGILTNATVGSINNGHATVLSADALIKLYYTIKTGYVNGSKWLLNRDSIRTIRTLKDGQGQYLWSAGFESTPATILGKAYVECPDMANIGSATVPIVFGDLKQAYMIVDRKNLQMMRDPYSQAGSGVVRFYAIKRVGGQIIKPEAVKKLVMSV